MSGGRGRRQEDGEGWQAEAQPQMNTDLGILPGGDRRSSTIFTGRKWGQKDFFLYFCLHVSAMVRGELHFDCQEWRRIGIMKA